MKDTIYFNHDYNAHLDPKVVKLRFKHWREWYWLYWATLEMMREDSDILIRWCELDANAYRLHCEIEKYKIFMSDLVEIWLIKYDKKDDVYYSCRLQSDVEYMRDKSAKASRSASIRWSKRDANALQTHSDGNAIDIYIDINKEKKTDSLFDVDSLIYRYFKRFETKDWQIWSRYSQLKDYCIENWHTIDIDWWTETIERQWDIPLVRRKKIKDVDWKFINNKVMDVNAWESKAKRDIKNPLTTLYKFMKS